MGRPKAQARGKLGRNEGTHPGVEEGEGLLQMLRGSQSSSRAQFFYVAKPTEEGTKRGGCQVVKGAGLRTLWCFDLRSQPLLLSFFKVNCFTYSAYVYLLFIKILF